MAFAIDEMMPVTGPSCRRAATMRRLRRWKYACQSIASSLSDHAMCQIAMPGHEAVGKPASPARRPYSPSSHLMNSGRGWPIVSATTRGIMHIHQPL